MIIKPTHMPNWVQYTLRLLATMVALFLLLSLFGRGLRRNVIDKSEVEPIDPEVVADYETLRNQVLDFENAPEFWVDVDYSEGRDASWWPKSESPMFAELVTEGKLPPVAERVGPEPVVYRGFAGIGQYGGDWWRLTEDIDSVRVAMQYELAGGQLARQSWTHHLPPSRTRLHQSYHCQLVPGHTGDDSGGNRPEFPRDRPARRGGSLSLGVRGGEPPSSLS